MEGWGKPPSSFSPAGALGHPTVAWYREETGALGFVNLALNSSSVCVMSAKLLHSFLMSLGFEFSHL